MKKISYILASILLAGSASFVTSCASEDPITEKSDATFDNPFGVPDDATGPEADIRRAFYKETNVFLVFHDLLRTYTDRFGNPQTETVDIAYELNGSKGYDYEYDEINDPEAQQVAADIIKKYYLPHIGGQLRPFSILAVDQITQVNSYGTRKKLNAINNFRTLALSMSCFDGVEDEAEIQSIVTDVLKEFIKSKVSYSDHAFEAFMAINNAHYYEDIINFIPDWDVNQDITKVYALGLLNYYEDGEHEYDYFRSASSDFESYLNLLFNYSEDEIRELYGDYPVIMKKYEMMRNAIEAIGYKF
ncbi:MAG: hypothetical protein K2J42_10660 [Muribaculaceae bacterium]|nr:hypothetical protein [Muribaculaceae bacterium]